VIFILKTICLFEREVSYLIIIQLIEFYIISKPIYRREILVKKVNIILIVIANLFLVAIVLLEKVNYISIYKKRKEKEKEKVIKSK
jgi:hypothetical protein